MALHWEQLWELEWAKWLVLQKELQWECLSALQWEQHWD